MITSEEQESGEVGTAVPHRGMQNTLSRQLKGCQNALQHRSRCSRWNVVIVVVAHTNKVL
jgi:hypothetical protein